MADREENEGKTNKIKKYFSEFLKGYHLVKNKILTKIAGTSFKN